MRVCEQTARDNQISYPTRWEKYDELGEKLDYILPYSIIKLIILSWELNELLLLTLRAFHVVRVYLGTWCFRLLFIFILELRWTPNESEKRQADREAEGRRVYTCTRSVKRKVISNDTTRYVLCVCVWTVRHTSTSDICIWLSCLLGVFVRFSDTTSICSGLVTISIHIFMNGRPMLDYWAPTPSRICRIVYILDVCIYIESVSFAVGKTFLHKHTLALELTFTLCAPSFPPHPHLLRKLPRTQFAYLLFLLFCSGCFYTSVYPLIRNSFPFCFWNNTFSVIYFLFLPHLSHYFIFASFS